VDLGVQGLDAAVEHLGEAGEFAYVLHSQAGFAQSAGGAAGGDELDVVPGEGLGEGDEAGLVGDAEQGAADGLQVYYCWQGILPFEGAGIALELESVVRRTLQGISNG